MNVSERDKYVNKTVELYEEGHDIEDISISLGIPIPMVKLFLKEAGKLI